MKVELVEWIDSCGHNGWHRPEEGSQVSHIKSVGWISDETDQAITITSHKCDVTQTHHSDLSVPKCAITKRTVIKSFKSKK